jgi:adenylyltransferase/sulfurtransferase
MESLIITPGEAKELLDSDEDVRLIDCREEDEFAICHLKRAELLPFSRFFHDAPSLLKNRHQKILIYCHHGMRSLRAAEALTQLGYTDVHSLAGGLEAWAQEIDPDMPQY